MHTSLGHDAGPCDDGANTLHAYFVSIDACTVFKEDGNDVDHTVALRHLAMAG